MSHQKSLQIQMPHAVPKKNEKSLEVKILMRDRISSASYKIIIIKITIVIVVLLRKMQMNKMKHFTETLEQYSEW